ncbi:MAG: DUF547 domain-containing protein [Myxococcota bacterium]|nr:DUF547 domain-containing protein [Myxococcota bacterium]
MTRPDRRRATLRKTQRTLRRCALVVAFLLAADATAFDEALYATLLSRHTRSVDDVAGTRVDYAGLAQSADWKRLVAGLEGVDRAALGQANRKLAFWINAYNVLAIDLVVRHYPVESIRDIGGFLTPVWKVEAGRIGGRPFTLHEIEHEILRPMGDPRIHAALVCASTSCPSLRRSPYTAGQISTQLDEATRQFLADRRKGLAVDPKRRRVRLSRIFDWFEDDFAAQGGPLGFAARYAPRDERPWLAPPAAGLRVEYFAYDWALNDLGNR